MLIIKIQNQYTGKRLAMKVPVLPRIGDTLSYPISSAGRTESKVVDVIFVFNSNEFEEIVVVV